MRFGSSVIQEPGEEGYVNPYPDNQYAPPPLVAVQVPEPSSKNDTSSLVGGLTNVVGGLVNIFGQKVGPPVAPIVSPPTPTWVLIAIPVVGIVAIGVLARALRKNKSVAGYRRRRSRR